MSAMTYSEEFLGTATGRKLSLGPLASDALPKFEHPVTSFTRPGPDVLSETIPVVFIGRNRDGFWVARCADGTFGGLFWRKGSALRFARQTPGPPDARQCFRRPALNSISKTTATRLLPVWGPPGAC